MKKILYLLFAAFTAFSCTQQNGVKVTVANSSSLDRENEMVEVSMTEISNKLNLADTAQIVVLDENNRQVPYQVTYDDMLIFPADVKANAQAVYTVTTGTPMVVDTKACGKYYPERVDDVAWENDRVAFRTYGPALQASGERAFGYDVWTKCVNEPVVEARYANELNPETLAKIDSLRKAGKKDEAKALYQSVSYHVDHGNGLDCYKVGPTLGGGAAALMVDNEIIYPYCYKEQEILDNGPLRFTVKLVYNPLTVKGDSNVVETRIISLDEGSQLNKTVVSYTNTNEVLPIVAGIVLHDPDGGKNAADAQQGYIAYADPTDNVNNNNGIIYVGAVFPANVKEAKTVFFPEQEKKELRGDADGHVLAISDYEPSSEFTYYWGAGWSKYGFNSFEEWTEYLGNYAAKVRAPLTVTIQ